MTREQEHTCSVSESGFDGFCGDCATGWFCLVPGMYFSHSPILRLLTWLEKYRLISWNGPSIKRMGSTFPPLTFDSFRHGQCPFCSMDLSILVPLSGPQATSRTSNERRVTRPVSNDDLDGYVIGIGVVPFP